VALAFKINRHWHINFYKKIHLQAQVYFSCSHSVDNYCASSIRFRRTMSDFSISPSLLHRIVVLAAVRPNGIWQPLSTMGTIPCVRGRMMIGTASSLQQESVNWMPGIRSSSSSIRHSLSCWNSGVIRTRITLLASTADGNAENIDSPRLMSRSAINPATRECTSEALFTVLLLLKFVSCEN